MAGSLLLPFSIYPEKNSGFLLLGFIRICATVKEVKTSTVKTLKHKEINQQYYKMENHPMLIK